MTDFNKKLEQSTARMREQAQATRNAGEAERQKQAAGQRSREATISTAHGVALRFMQKCIEPIASAIHKKIPRAAGREYAAIEHGFAGWCLEFGDTEQLALRAHFDEQGVWLSAEARCRGKGIVYGQKSAVFACAQFDESKAQEWIQAHALEAYEAFLQNAVAIQNRSPIVTISGVAVD
jgi:hypothetical protein